MKKSIALLFGCLFLLGQVQAQFLKSKSGKVLKNGSITYSLNVESQDPTASMLNNSTFSLDFNGDKSKLNGLIMGGMFAGDIIMDAKNEKGVALLNILGQKKAIPMKSADIQKAKASSSGLDKAKVQQLSGTKKIAGYTCKKMLMKNPDQPQGQMIVYISDQIKPSSAGMLDGFYEKFNGFPLGIEIDSPEGKLKIFATDVSKKIPKSSIFDMKIPSGYEETTIENLMQEMGGAMGG